MSSPGERQQALLALAAAFVSLATTGWYSMPEHQRAAVKMRAALTLRRWCRLAAAAAGRQAIATEATTGRREYGLSYTLALAGERAGRWYERLREVTT